MRSFKDTFYGLEPLEESLNSAVDFYLTDDTKLPKRVAATFTLGKTEYGMSLEESQFKKTYILRFYRIANSKGRLWRFGQKSHILPCLSTLMKFVESAILFFQGQFDAILVIYNKQLADAKRIDKFVQRMIKKSYITQFRYVPVEGNINNKSYAYSFIINKKKGVAQVFSSKTFDGIKFDPKEPVPAETAENLYSTAIYKSTISTKPSKKYSLGSYDLDVDKAGDAEALEKVKDVKPILTTDEIEKEKSPENNIENLATDLLDSYTGYELLLYPKRFESLRNDLSSNPYDPQKLPISMYQLRKLLDLEAKENPVWAKAMIKLGVYTEIGGGWDFKKIKSYMQTYANLYYKDHKTYELQVQNKLNSLNLPKESESPEADTFNKLLDYPEYSIFLSIPQFASLRKSLETHGFDKSKVVESDLQYVLKTAMNENPIWKKAMSTIGVYNDNNNEFNLQKIYNHMDMYASFAKDGIKDYGNEVQTLFNKLNTQKNVTSIKNLKLGSSSDQKIERRAGSVPASDLELIDNTFQQSPVLNPKSFRFEGYEETYKINELNKHLEKDLGYYDYIETHSQKQKLNSYTEFTYDSGFNNPLRYAAKVFKQDNYPDSAVKDAANRIKGSKNISGLWKIFEDVKPLPMSMWVFRNAEILPEYYNVKPGDDFVDPAFISCTLDPNMKYGGNDRLAIYVPKGSIVLPVLGQTTAYSSEYEVLLPPMSVLKVMDVSIRKSNYNDTYAIITTYTGTAFPDFMKLAKQKASIAEALLYIRMNQIGRTKETHYTAKI